MHIVQPLSQACCMWRLYCRGFIFELYTILTCSMQLQRVHVSVEACSRGDAQ